MLPQVIACLLLNFPTKQTDTFVAGASGTHAASLVVPQVDVDRAANRTAYVWKYNKLVVFHLIHPSIWPTMKKIATSMMMAARPSQ
jgi:hypothetical protein